MFLAVSGILSTVFVGATAVFGWDAAAVTLLLWTIYSFVVAVACFAWDWLADIVEHSCGMRGKREFWFEIVGDETILCDTVVGVEKVVVDEKDEEHKGETLLHLLGTVCSHWTNQIMVHSEYLCRFCTVGLC